MTADHDTSGPIPFEASHRSQPRLQPSVVSLDPVVGVLGRVVKGGRHELDNHPHQGMGTVGVDLGRLAVGVDRRNKGADRSLQITVGAKNLIRLAELGVSLEPE